ncbi:MAG: hypothetical protein ACPGNV_07195 [Mangrovicoccus sp.]
MEKGKLISLLLDRLAVFGGAAALILSAALGHAADHPQYDTDLAKACVLSVPAWDIDPEFHDLGDCPIEPGCHASLTNALAEGQESALAQLYGADYMRAHQESCAQVEDYAAPTTPEPADFGGCGYGGSNGADRLFNAALTSTAGTDVLGDAPLSLLCQEDLAAFQDPVPVIPIVPIATPPNIDETSATRNPIQVSRLDPPLTPIASAPITGGSVRTARNTSPKLPLMLGPLQSNTPGKPTSPLDKITQLDPPVENIPTNGPSPAGGISPAPVPLPQTILLVLGGIGALYVAGRRQKTL